MDETKPRPVVPVLGELIAEAERHLELLQYRPDTRAHYRAVWKGLASFAGATTHPDEFSEELAERFLVSRGVPLAGPAAGRQARQLRTSMRVLSEIALHGCFQRRRGAVEQVPLDAPMAEALQAYESYCREYATPRRTTLRVRRRVLTTFLLFLSSHGVSKPAAIEPRHLSAFVRSRSHLASRTVSTEISLVRSFLRICQVIGVIARDLGSELPHVRVRHYARVPSVWKADDVQAVLRAVDRSSPMGKRDFAILLLACRFGLRVGDIRGLTLDAFEWDRSRLVLQQAKTRARLELPLSDEVASAVIDYLRHGRPPSRHRVMFLRANAPFEPFGADNNLHEIITKYRRLAGVALARRQRTGLHSLRHTVATTLLAEGISLEVIREILGHESLETTRIYTRADIVALRTAALETDEGPRE